MALTKPAQTTQPAGGFEPMDDDTAVKPVASQTTTAQAAPAANDAAPAQAANDAPKATAVAAPASTGIVTSDRAAANAFAAELQEMRGAADFSYGNFETFKGNNGEIKKNGGATLGRWVHGTMTAWDDHWEISPGADTEKSKELVAYSKDGDTIDSVIGESYRAWVGRKVEDYVKYLTESADYPKARAARFVDIAFAVRGCESEAVAVGEIVQITLSQSSIPSFESYQSQLQQKARAIARGVPGIKLPEDPFTFYFIREAAEKAGKSWTKLRISATLPTKL